MGENQNSHIAWNQYNSLDREAVKKTVLFGTFDPNVGGRGPENQNFYKSLQCTVLWHICPLFACKFTVEITFCVPNFGFTSFYGFPY